MDHSELEDLQLVRQIANGDRDALAALYRRHSHVLFGQILLVVNDRGVSEEILQDTMIAVWHGASGFRGDSKVRSWAIAIAVKAGTRSLAATPASRHGRRGPG